MFVDAGINSKVNKFSDKYNGFVYRYTNSIMFFANVFYIEMINYNSDYLVKWQYIQNFWIVFKSK